MTILKLKIDNIGYEIECKKGEENLLRKAEELLNLNLDNNPHLKTLPQSKKFLMLSLVLAADLTFSKKQFKAYFEAEQKALAELNTLTINLNKIYTESLNDFDSLEFKMQGIINQIYALQNSHEASNNK